MYRESLVRATMRAGCVRYTPRSCSVPWICKLETDMQRRMKYGSRESKNCTKIYIVIFLLPKEGSNCVLREYLTWNCFIFVQEHIDYLFQGIYQRYFIWKTITVTFILSFQRNYALIEILEQFNFFIWYLAQIKNKNISPEKTLKFEYLRNIQFFHLNVTTRIFTN